MTDTEQANIARVREAFDTLFNRHDAAAAEAYWSPAFKQHAGLVPPGRAGILDVVRRMPDIAYDCQSTAAAGDTVFLFGRYRNIPGHDQDMVAADILRVADGVIVEQWSVMQDEFTQEQSQSGLPMFGDTFAA